MTSASGQVPTVYDRMCWPQAVLEQALASGAHERELHAYLGDGEYSLLRTLARRALATKMADEAPSVYVLPGILGSQLGRPPAAPADSPDLLWLDPDDIVGGRLLELKPDEAGSLKPLGAVVYNYLPLRLRLVAAGLPTTLYDYDWRQDLLLTARALAAKLDADPARRLVLIGHSMGGLLARAALPLCAPATRDRLHGFIGLGTPHGGSLAAVQALRATYPVVLRLAAMDRGRDAHALTMQAFRYFSTLYQMLPIGLSGDEAALDLFDPDSWPTSGAVPDPALLKLAQSFHARLAGAEPHWVSIVGTGKRTVTAVSRDTDEFRYEVSSAGDGTVSIRRAILPGSRVYSLRCEHSELPRSPTVAAALVDLIGTGETARLAADARATPGNVVRITDSTIRDELQHKLDWHHLSVVERRAHLDNLSDPPACYHRAR